jgi:hypothetical protein
MTIDALNEREKAACSFSVKYFEKEGEPYKRFKKISLIVKHFVLLAFVILAIVFREKHIVLYACILFIVYGHIANIKTYRLIDDLYSVIYKLQRKG